jgi:prophage maintenance system killer protein
VHFLTLDQVFELHARILEQSGGAEGVRNLAALESSIAQPRQTFEGRELYPSIPAKAAGVAGRRIVSALLVAMGIAIFVMEGFHIMRP